MAQTSSGAGWEAVAGAAASSAGQMAVDHAKSKKGWKYLQKSMALQQKMNKETWDMQNAYNTPQAQMQRLQEGGLNPRLIYGSGSSAPNMAGPLDTAQAPVREAVGGKFPDLLTYYQIRQADAQYRNTTMNTQVMEKTAALKDIEQGLKNLELFRETFRSKDAQRHAMFETDLKMFLSQRARYLRDNEATKGFMMDQLMNMRQKQATGLDLDNAFKQHRNELAKLGIYQSDHPAFRVLIQAAKRMNIDLGDLIAEGADNLKYLFELKSK